MTSTVVMVGRQ